MKQQHGVLTVIKWGLLVDVHYELVGNASRSANALTISYSCVRLVFLVHAQKGVNEREKVVCVQSDINDAAESQSCNR